MIRKPLLLLGLLFLIPHSAISEIVVKNAWVRAAPTGAKTMAAYMLIDNQGSKIMSSSKIIANGFEKAEVHKSFIDNNIAQMRKLENISINGKESLTLEPGGLHLMLINPEKVPKKNSKVEILIFFENADNAEVVRIEAVVRSQEL
tara:strand:+ start:70 stop:507 length:438 start_codon:yes stop_codon:yes gene_type:complete